MFDDTFRLLEGHGRNGNCIGKFQSIEDAEAVATTISDMVVELQISPAEAATKIRERLEEQKRCQIITIEIEQTAYDLARDVFDPQTDGLRFLTLKNDISEALFRYFKKGRATKPQT